MQRRAAQQRHYEDKIIQMRATIVGLGADVRLREGRSHHSHTTQCTKKPRATNVINIKSHGVYATALA